MKDTDWHGVRGVNAELIRDIKSLKSELSEARAGFQRWRLVKEFHPLLRLEHWDGHGWGPLYGEAADRIVDELILNSCSASSTKGAAGTPVVEPTASTAPVAPDTFPRANPDELESFDPSTKECTMNCGPHRDDPRSAKERKLLCDDCLVVKP